MRRIIKLGIFCFTLAIVLVAIPFAEAQLASEAAPAPVPIQILTGKKVFISNGESTALTGIPNLPYNGFYALMKSWGKYELVSAPAQADLVFEIRFVTPAGPIWVRNGDSGPPPSFQLRLVILDPKTHVVLWAFIKPVPDWPLVSNRYQYFDEAMAALMDEVKKLTTPSNK